MTCYKVTCIFAPDWRILFKAIFGNDAVHCYSEETPNVSLYHFEGQVVPNDMGPLVIIEAIDPSHSILK